MSESFFKFPSTPHLATLSNIDIRNDKILSEIERSSFLSHEITIEEKTDGANLGLSFDKNGNILAQNRGGYIDLPSLGQWKKLDNWLAHHSDVLFEFLSDQFILFGEWCYAQHTIHYDYLPDWFIAFDIFDKKINRFFSTYRRDKMITEMSLTSAPFLGRGHYQLSDLIELLPKSSFADSPAEGIYLRYDEGDWLKARAKLIRPSFIQSVESHWSKAPIKPNDLIFTSGKKKKC